MKKNITSLLTALLLGSAVAMAGEPGIEFANTSHDFGNIKEDGDPVSCEFEFTNTGDEPLVIISANASCGCTRPEFPKKPIQPGKKGVIKVTYLPKGRPGEFTKSVRVRTNAKQAKKVNIKISGVVIPQQQ